MRSTIRTLLGIGLPLLLVACAIQPPPATPEAPGFLFGLLHGAISPFALVGSFFMDIRVYAFPNGGVWYDLGFVLGTAMTFSGGSRAV